MTWNRPELLLWMAAFLAAAWLSPRRWQLPVVATVGLCFLGWAAPLSLALLAALGLASYFVARDCRGNFRRLLATVALVVGTIVVAKWGVRLDDSPLAGTVPLGLSFYGLRIIHYAIDAFGGRLPAHSFGDYLRYLAFMPTMIAGPINRFEEFCRDSRRRRWDVGLFTSGLERILYGYVKIVVLANQLAVTVFGGWLHRHGGDATWLGAYLGCLQYGLNLYLQFAGYSDVAIGLALLAGFRVSENFNWPFAAVNINDFWKRWHMTLSGWCRDYVFSPVSALARSPYLGVLASMLALGLWHEFTFRYCLWGLYHGAGIAAWQYWQGVKRRWQQLETGWRGRAYSAASWALTLNFVILSFAITRAEGPAEAWRILRTIGTLAGGWHV